MKKINLRKASAILHALGATINDITINNTIRFTEFSEDVAGMLNIAEEGVLGIL